MYHDLKIYCSMLLSTIPKSPPKIIRENTYTDSENKGQFLLRILVTVEIYWAVTAFIM